MELSADYPTECQLAITRGRRGSMKSNLRLFCDYYRFLTVSVALLTVLCAVSNAAALAIISPNDGSTVSGTIAINSNLQNTFWWTQLTLDGAALASNASGNFSWDSTTVANGSHVLSVRGFQENGSAPVAAASVNVTVNNSNNLTTYSYFSTLPPNSQLPSESWCAGAIAATPEKISSNATANASMPSGSQLAAFHAYPSGSVPSSYYAKVDGQYTGSTDMIMRWAACKWGIDENIVRAQAWGESGGIQGTIGDWTTDTSLCPSDGAWSGSRCGQSYGVMQIKYVFQPDTWPMISTSTAFNLDYRLSIQRACMDGQIGYLANDTPTPGYPSYPNGTSDQMLWGCIGSWYSGGWYDQGALSYNNWVQTQLSEQQWLY